MPVMFFIIRLLSHCCLHFVILFFPSLYFLIIIPMLVPGWLCTHENQIKVWHRELSAHAIIMNMKIMMMTIVWKFRVNLDVNTGKKKKSNLNRNVVERKVRVKFNPCLPENETPRDRWWCELRDSDFWLIIRNDSQPHSGMPIIYVIIKEMCVAG